MGDTTTATGEATSTTGTEGEGGEATTTNNQPTELEVAQAEAEKWKNLSRQNEKNAKKALADLEKAQQGSMSDVERAVAEATTKAKAEALAETLNDRVTDKVRIAAAGKFADLEDAIALLGDLGDRFIVSGEIDEKAITKAIDELIEKKPYLAAGTPPPKPGQGKGASEGGPRGGAPATDKPKGALQEGLESMLGISPG